MKMLVTGGARLIGSFVIRDIITGNKDDMVNFDTLT